MRIGVVTTGRSDAGILEPLIQTLGEEALVFDTNYHLKSDALVGQASAIGTVAKEMSESLFKCNLDKIVLLGDRYETVATALAAYSLHIPIVHLEGGEITNGSLDQGYRWCISELATYHCAATKKAVKRLKSCGMTNVYHTGALGCHGLDTLIPWWASKRIYDFVFCYYPSLEQHDPLPYVRVLAELGTVLWVGPNNDAGRGLVASRMTDPPQGVVTTPSLTREVFLAYVKAAKAIVGNSSAGIIEAPSLGTRTINIGCRQEGREAAKSVVYCPEKADWVRMWAKKAIRETPKKYPNPYYKKDCLKKIIEICRK